MILKNLTATTMRITSRYKDIYAYDADLKDWMENGVQKYAFRGGYTAGIFLTLQEMFGFDYEFVTDVGPYNFSLATNKSVDLFVGSYSLYYGRAKMVDPTFLTGHSKIIAILNHEHEGNDENIFLLPFSKGLWLGLLFFSLACIFFIAIVGLLTKVVWQDSVFLTVAVLLQKACSISSPGMGFTVCVSTSTVLIMACYTGNMFSIKAVHRFAINSLESLVHSHYKILLELGDKTSTIHVMFKDISHIPIIQLLVNRIAATKFVYSTFEAAVQEVLKRPAAHIIDEETGMSTIEKELGELPCSWSAISVLNLKYPWSMYMRKNSPFKDTINYGILKIDETGIRRRLRKKWIPQATECKLTSVPFTSIRLTQVYTACLIYLGGVFLSLFFLTVFEMKYFCCTICYI